MNFKNLNNKTIFVSTYNKYKFAGCLKKCVLLAIFFLNKVIIFQVEILLFLL